MSADLNRPQEFCACGAAITGEVLASDEEGDPLCERCLKLAHEAGALRRADDDSVIEPWEGLNYADDDTETEPWQQ